MLARLIMSFNLFDEARCLVHQDEEDSHCPQGAHRLVGRIMIKKCNNRGTYGFTF